MAFFTALPSWAPGAGATFFFGSALPVVVFFAGVRLAVPFLKRPLLPRSGSWLAFFRVCPFTFTVDDVRAVAEAGARFAMSPVLDPAVVAEAHRLGMLAIPGGGSATEILAAHRAGAKLVKVFPSGPLGGPDFLRKIRGPLPHIPLVPTSGPAIETFADYVDAGAVAVGVGSEVFAPGFTPESVEGAAQRTRDAWRRAHK